VCPWSAAHRAHGNYYAVGRRLVQDYYPVFQRFKELDYTADVTGDALDERIAIRDFIARVRGPLRCQMAEVNSPGPRDYLSPDDRVCVCSSLSAEQKMRGLLNPFSDFRVRRETPASPLHGCPNPALTLLLACPCMSRHSAVAITPCSNPP
jgi:hypothetical protein